MDAALLGRSEGDHALFEGDVVVAVHQRLVLAMAITAAPLPPEASEIFGGSRSGLYGYTALRLAARTGSTLGYSGRRIWVTAGS